MTAWQHISFPEELESKPWKFSFFQLCRWLDAQSAPRAPLGLSPLPHDESLRLGQSPSTTFATREIDTAFRKRGRLHLHLLGLGLFGPHGPLPLHISEEAHERALVVRDTTLADFLNIFHHRWLTQFYRAWSSGQATAGLDRPEEEKFSFYVSCLAGQCRSQNHARMLPQSHARMGAVGHLVRRSRNAAGLVATLEKYFAVPVRLTEYRFHWLELEADSHCRLGRKEQPCRLGQDAVLGGHVPDRQCAFALHFGPLTLERYCLFLPGQKHLQALVQWVREFVGVELHWTLHLTLAPEEVPLCTLDGTMRLGRTTWLGHSSGSTPVCGTAFAPEKAPTATR